MIELLAPGGNIENVKIAFATGADAVYIGMKSFSARNKCDNFDYSGLEELMLIAKLTNKKVYVALNTVLKDSEIDEFLKAVKICEKLKVDAIILQDLFLGKFLKEKGCQIPLHASTQSGVCTVDSAKVCEEFGFSRIILSRETTLEEIKKIRKATSLEIEYFIQGALCVSFSGNCYFSSLVDGNSGNRGKCFQPCRKKYTLKGKNFSREGYLISPKDLCMDNHISDLIEAGVCSFKIEGRLRRSEYVGSSVAHYRSVIDGKKNEDTKRNLKVSFNRGDYSTGYLLSRKSKIIAPNIQNHIGIEIGTVTKKTGNNRFFVKSKYRPNIGDGFKIIYDSKEIGGVEHQKGLLIKNEGFEIFSNLAVVGATVNLTTDKSLNEKYSNIDFKMPINVEYFIKVDKLIKIKYQVQDISFEYTSEIIPQIASNAPLSAEKLEKNLSKFGDTIFSCKNISGELDDNLFLGVSQINEIRRNSIEKFMNFLKISMQNNNETNYSYNKNIYEVKHKKSAIIIDEFSNTDKFCDIHIFKPTTWNINIFKDIKLPKENTYLYIPCFYDSEDKNKIISLYKSFDFEGVFIENYGGLQIAKELNCKVFIGEKLNITNSISYDIAKIHADKVCFSKELAIHEIPNVDGYIISYGGLEAMTFAHCPLIANDICTCKNCQYHEEIKYIDENQREFQLKRMKIASCQFNLYYNTGIDAREFTKNYNNISDITIINEKYTLGNLERGIK